MNLNELIAVARHAAHQESKFRRDGSTLEAIVLAVFDEVRKAVPEERGEARPDEKAFGWYVAGWNACRVEMLRRLDKMSK